MNTQAASPSSRWTALIIVLATAGATALRLPNLDRRPMHGDEAVHADKLHTLWQTGEYHYDPNEYHGPTLYYLTLPVLKLAGCRTFSDFTETQLRLVPALLGIALIPLLWLIRDGLGNTGVGVAAILTAASTAMTFYSRYYIQEMLLVFFTFLMLAAGWRYWQSRKTSWAVLMGVAAGLMHATKETSVIAFGCAAAAAIAVNRFNRTPTQTQAGDAWVASRGFRDAPEAGAVRDTAAGGGGAASCRPLSAILPGLLLAVGVAGLTSALFYSAFFTNPRGPLDSLLTYRTYFDRAGNHGLHNHPWWYYLQILAWTKWAPGPWWSEGVILVLFSVGVISALRPDREAPKSEIQDLKSEIQNPKSEIQNPKSEIQNPKSEIQNPIREIRNPKSEIRNPKCPKSDPDGGALVQPRQCSCRPHCGLLRFLCIYTVLMLVAYSAIPYKTPWCMLGFLHGMILIAGAGFVALLAALRRRVLQTLICATFAAAIGHMVWQTLRADGRFCADNRNPYVYAHPVNDVLRLAGFITRLRDVHPNPAGMVIQVVSPDADYWPLPWYLRRCENVGYWNAAPRSESSSGDPSGDGDVLIVPAGYWPGIEAGLNHEYETFYYGLRPDVPLVVAVDRDLWQRFRQSEPRP